MKPNDKKPKCEVIDYRNTERGKQWLKKMIEGIGKRDPQEIILEMESTTRNSSSSGTTAPRWPR